jgi:heat shock protein HtpX
MENDRRSPLDLGIPVHGFTLSTEIAKGSLISFPKFLTENSSSGRFGSIAAGDFHQIAGEHGKFLIFNTVWPQENYSATIRMKLESPLAVDIFSYSKKNEGFNKRLEEYLLLSLQIFEESIRKDTVYMAFVPGSEATSKLGGRSSISEKLFRGNMLNLFLLSIILGVLLLFLLQSIGLGSIAPFVMIIVLLSIVLSAGKILAIRSDWRITEKNTDVVIIECKLDSNVVPTFFKDREISLSALKRRLYEMMTYEKRHLSHVDVAALFTEAGIPAVPEQVVVKRINIYEIVKRAAMRFEMPIPAIVVTKNPNPNAAAMGFSKRLATMLITFGLLVQLEEKEIELVVGHELSHLRFGDTAILFSIIVSEYLLRVYVFLPYIAAFSLIYLVFIFWLIFFFGKFLEARADLEAAYILRDPQTMANSLKKIGFKRLLLDSNFIEGKQTSFGDWLAFDPHPPLGFRIRRMENLDLNDVPKHTLLRSISDVFSGMSSSRRK